MSQTRSAIPVLQTTKKNPDEFNIKSLSEHLHRLLCEDKAP